MFHEQGNMDLIKYQGCIPCLPSIQTKAQSSTPHYKEKNEQSDHKRVGRDWKKFKSAQKTSERSHKTLKTRKKQSFMRSICSSKDS